MRAIPDFDRHRPRIRAQPPRRLGAESPRLLGARRPPGSGGGHESNVRQRGTKSVSGPSSRTNAAISRAARSRSSRLTNSFGECM